MKVRPSSSRILGEAQDFRGIELIFYCAFISSKGVTRIIKLLINIIRYYNPILFMRIQIEDRSNYYRKDINLKCHLILLPVCLFMCATKPERLISYQASDHEVTPGLKFIWRFTQNALRSKKKTKRIYGQHLKYNNSRVRQVWTRYENISMQSNQLLRIAEYDRDQYEQGLFMW